jgi:hypothetical protein
LLALLPLAHALLADSFALLAAALVFVAQVIVVVIPALVPIPGSRLGDAQHGGVMHSVELRERAQRESPGLDVLNRELRQFPVRVHAYACSGR